MVIYTLTDSRIVDNALAGSRDHEPGGVQLPHADIVHQAPLEPSPQFRNWPNLNTRLEWAYRTGIALNLSSRERAVLQRVCYRAGQHQDGRPPGCWESATNIGAALGYHRNHIGRALAALVDKGLLTATRRFSNSTIHRPTMAELSTISICNKTVQMDAPKRCTNRKVQPEGLYAQGSKSFMVLEDIEPGQIVDDAESCGFTGCPPVDRVCPMCGRLGRR